MNYHYLLDTATKRVPPIPSTDQVRKWVRESNHNEPMFYQVACMAAEWAFDIAITTAEEVLR